MGGWLDCGLGVVVCGWMVECCWWCWVLFDWVVEFLLGVGLSGDWIVDWIGFVDWFIGLRVGWWVVVVIGDVVVRGVCFFWWYDFGSFGCVIIGFYLDCVWGGWCCGFSFGCCRGKFLSF